jgi:hypothetical protein
MIPSKILRTMLNQLTVYLFLLVNLSLVSCFFVGCSGKPSPTSMQRTLTERLGECRNVIAVENFKKLNGRDVDDRHYTAEVSYDLVLKQEANIQGNPADAKGAAACAYAWFPSAVVFHGRTGVYPAGSRHQMVDDLEYENTEKGWLPTY